MKLPWKYLTQLTLRRRPVKVDDDVAADDTRSETSDAIDTPASVKIISEPSSVLERNEAVDATSEPIERNSGISPARKAPAIGKKSAASKQVTSAGVEPSNAKVVQETQKKVPDRERVTLARRARQVRAGMADQSQAVKNRSTSVKPVRAQPAPLAETGMDVLDREIRDLRVKLIEKLRLQNNQLRDMLARFDQS